MTMNMGDLIPWGRQTSVQGSSSNEGANPLLSLHREMNGLFDDAFRGFGHGGLALGQTTAWPNLEVSDTENEVRITAELPGMSEKDVELLVEDGVLTLRGEKRSETEAKDRGYSERCYGRLERRVALPSGVDGQDANATFKDGVLKVTLRKSPEAERGRRIPINAETRH
jgi:HSP20 family protein